MGLVLNVPMPPHQVQHTPGCRPLGVQTGNPRDHLGPLLSRLLEDDMTPHRKDLRQTGPITVAHERLPGRAIALLDAPMAAVYRAGGLLTVARRREWKDQRDIGLQLRLILFDDHDIIA